MKPWLFDDWSQNLIFTVKILDLLIIFCFQTPVKQLEIFGHDSFPPEENNTYYWTSPTADLITVRVDFIVLILSLPSLSVIPLTFL